MEALSRSELATWLILFRDTRDGLARTSLEDIARRGGMARRTAWRAVQGLQKKGLLKVVRRGGLGRGPSAYQVLSQPFPLAA
jgi:DNA-binding IclR family transcriptional regulator